MTKPKKTRKPREFNSEEMHLCCYGQSVWISWLMYDDSSEVSLKDAKRLRDWLDKAIKHLEENGK